MLVSNPEANENARRPIDELTVAEEDQVATAFAGILRSREFAWTSFLSCWTVCRKPAMSKTQIGNGNSWPIRIFEIRGV